MKRAPRAYVAGPITSSGSLHENIHNGIMVGEELRARGIHPFIPHLYDFVKIVTGEDVNWEDMLQLDENWIRACDLLVFLPGESKGRAREVAFAKSLKIPVIELKQNSIYEPLAVSLVPEVREFIGDWWSRVNALTVNGVAAISG